MLLQESEASTEVGEPYMVTIRSGPPWQIPPTTPAVPLKSIKSFGLNIKGNNISVELFNETRQVNLVKDLWNKTTFETALFIRHCCSLAFRHALLHGLCRIRLSDVPGSMLCMRSLWEHDRWTLCWQSICYFHIMWIHGQEDCRRYFCMNIRQNIVIIDYRWELVTRGWHGVSLNMPIRWK